MLLRLALAKAAPQSREGIVAGVFRISVNDVRTNEKRERVRLQPTF